MKFYSILRMVSVKKNLTIHENLVGLRQKNSRHEARTKTIQR